MSKIKNSLTLVFLLILIILLFFIPIKLPNSIVTGGLVYPIQEYIIKQSTDGRFSTETVNHFTGSGQINFTSQMERGDVSSLIFSDELIGNSNNNLISTGDTIAKISSQLTVQEISRLKGEIQNAKRELLIYESGEKESLLDEAEKKILFAQEQVKEQEKIVARNKALKDKGILSEAEYDLSVNQLELYKIEVGIAKSQYDVLAKGEKQSVAEYYKSIIRSLEDELRTVERKSDLFNIISHVNGIITGRLSADTLLTVSDTSEYVVLIAIKVEELEKLGPASEVYINHPDISHMNPFQIEKMDNKSYNLLSGQVAIAIVKLDLPLDPIMIGRRLECKIDLENKTIQEIVISFFKNLLSHF
ncbi:MAG: hypothetical protein K9J16_09170 [Melioribacteraceae bacterium]|nr:hypothetical protein [Melioribacteraceae bacterium]MCF8353223.1 hypothetical protein [Melioribacteraceae bacterium]MCF8395614.1 hypothetical protein [Melioribacteraceae bacterium]MCF8418743.1 hypothetical protein [Melioribacteraceae bacterium]